MIHREMNCFSLRSACMMRRVTVQKHIHLRDAWFIPSAISNLTGKRTKGHSQQ